MKMKMMRIMRMSDARGHTFPLRSHLATSHDVVVVAAEVGVEVVEEVAWKAEAVAEDGAVVEDHEAVVAKAAEGDGNKPPMWRMNKISQASESQLLKEERLHRIATPAVRGPALSIIDTKKKLTTAVTILDLHLLLVSAFYS